MLILIIILTSDNRVYIGIKQRFNEMNEKILEELKGMNGVKAVYLFGSYAKGKELPFSDIDICAIGKFNEKEKSEISSLSSEKIQISIFDELPIYIKFRVFKEGKQLFCRDEEFLQKVTFSTLKEYLDFKPLLKRFERFYLVGA